MHLVIWMRFSVQMILMEPLDQVVWMELFYHVVQKETFG